jgi:hypothetical protein
LPCIGLEFLVKLDNPIVCPVPDPLEDVVHHLKVLDNLPLVLLSCFV